MAVITRTEAGRDGDGNTTWTESAALVVGLFAPGFSSEQTAGQDQVATQPEAILQPGQAAVHAGDAFVPDPVLNGTGQLVLDDDGKVQGERYEVDGNPESWEPGTVVRLKRVTG